MRRLKNLVKQVLTKKENRRYQKRLAARCVSYDSWVREQENAEILIERYFAEHPQVQILYGDEDVCRNGVRSNPWYKPDWSPDLFDCWYYFGSVVAVRRELWEKYHGPAKVVQQEKESFVILNAHEISDGEEQEAFVNRIRGCLEVCGGWQKGCKAVGHIPEILYHCDSVEEQARYMRWKTAPVGAGYHNEERIEEKDNRETSITEVELSVVIPSKDNPKILEKCVRAIVKTEKKLNYELIIMDNGSSQENRQRIETLLGEYAAKYIYEPMEFNFSKMCNLGADNASGEMLLFLNDDVELCGENCLSELAELAVKEHVGAVGMKLYYPDSNRIQHAGITNLPIGPVHKLQFLEDDKDYYFGINRGLRNMLAVTAACLMVETKKFWEVQGFAEDLQVAFNDVDLCFKLYEQGYYNICNNGCYAYHHESLSRGDDESTEKWQRLIKERDNLYRKHPELEGKDPFYGAGLGKEGLDTRVRPEFETAGNRIQRLCDGGAEKGGNLIMVTPEALAAYRQDNCLLLRVENCRQGMLQGYGVVLGDDNACYDKRIVLETSEKLGEDGGGEHKCYLIPMEGQYRPELVENMPDQVNVGLSGFWLDTVTAGLPKGNYRIGMTARNRMTGLKLINRSSRILIVE